jgi:hypothetical protein
MIRVPHSLFSVRCSSVGCSVAQKDAAKLRRVQQSSEGCSLAQRVQCSSEGCSLAQRVQLNSEGAA